MNFTQATEVGNIKRIKENELGCNKFCGDEITSVVLGQIEWI